MATLAVNFEELHEPSCEEVTAAGTAARQLRTFYKGKPVSFIMERDEKTQDAPEPITLPAAIFRIIIQMLGEMGKGNAVAVVPVSAELTTQQAADLLNVSRPHLIKLLEADQLSFRMVGTHRKLKAKDVIAYRDRMSHSRRNALSAMVAESEELGMYDDEPVSRD